MPLYEYECDACGRRFEQIQKFSDPPVAACPTCGGSVKKLVSTPAIQFKGSGFYITDYARSGKAGGEGEGKSEKGSPQKADGPTSDKTSEQKSDKAPGGGGEAAPSGSSETSKSGSAKPATTPAAKD